MRGAWAHATLATLACLAVAGCDGAAARRYAVTVVEPEKLDCKAKARVGEPTQGKQIADQIEGAWKEALNAIGGTQRPVGRVLQLTETADDVTGWFDAPISSSVDSFGTSEQVMLGDPHDDYVEVTFRQAHDANDEEAAAALGIEPCGELEDFAFTLSVTVDGSEIEGRVRRVVRQYIPLGISPCDEVVTCPRSLAVTGVEIEE